MTSHVRRGAQQRQVWISSDVYTLSVESVDSDGDVSLTDGWIPPGGGPPPHIHETATELIYVHSGEITVTIDSIEHELSSGDTAVIAPNTVHFFRNTTTTPTRLLFIFTPAGTEQFFAEAGAPAIPGVPVPIATEADNQRAADIGLQYGLTPAP